MQLDRMAQLGLCHQDLNLNNIMVSSVSTETSLGYMRFSLRPKT
jgi:tRNA A-37 threonylcarbamoyl transferase component Bud32